MHTCMTHLGCTARLVTERDLDLPLRSAAAPRGSSAPHGPTQPKVDHVVIGDDVAQRVIDEATAHATRYLEVRGRV